MERSIIFKEPRYNVEFQIKVSGDFYYYLKDFFTHKKVLVWIYDNWQAKLAKFAFLNVFFLYIFRGAFM